MDNTDLNINVQMGGDHEKAIRSYNQNSSRVLKLGKEIKISPKTCAFENKPGYSMKFFVESVSVTVGIGKNHVATLVMSKEAYEALNDGEQISITTKQEFIDKYL